ncbi:MAG: hypothetical protein Q9161_001162 [Pseudevernia consocians]
MAFSEDPYPSPPPSPAQFKADPILRNALRYTLSAKEYKTLHQYLISRSPPAVRKRTLPPPKYAALVQTKDDYNGAAIRASLRVFIATQTSLKLWELVQGNLFARGKPQRVKPRIPFLKSPNLRLSLSLSLLLLLHRLLFRFFSRLRSNLLTRDAAPFRRRNPRVSRSLTSRLAPAIGASLAGLALGVYPGDHLRVSIAIYAATRSLEFAYKALEEDGWFKGKPWWWGRIVFRRPTVTSSSTTHPTTSNADPSPIPQTSRGQAQTQSLIRWPRCHNSIGRMLPLQSAPGVVALTAPSRPFISPILFPSTQTLPPSLTQLAPITSPAHPSHTFLSCATLHPSTPSCLTTFIRYILTAFPTLAKFFTAYYTLFALPKWRKFVKEPSYELNALAKRVLRTSAFLTGAIGTSWGSICLFQNLFPRTLMPSSRWVLGGTLGGMWGFIDRRGGHGHFLYSIRLSIDSLWKVGKKRGWWKGVQGGDVMLFVAGLGVVNVVFENHKECMGGAGKGIGWLRGEELFSNVKDEQLSGEEKRK